MIATPHILVGAAAGRGIRFRLPAVLVAWASHFMMDYIPHLDWNGLYRAGLISRKMLYCTACLDLLAGLTLAAWLTRRIPRMRVMVMACALIAVLPDAFRQGVLLTDSTIRQPVMAAFTNFHHLCQNNLPPQQWPWGVLTQAVACALVIVMFRLCGNNAGVVEHVRK